MSARPLATSLVGARPIATRSFDALPVVFFRININKSALIGDIDVAGSGRMRADDRFGAELGIAGAQLVEEGPIDEQRMAVSNT